MVWEAPLFLGGPVFTWELVRAQRQRWLLAALVAYLGWLGFGYLGFVGELDRGVPVSGAPRSARQWREATALEADRRVRAAADYVAFHLRQAMILLVLILPAAVGCRLSQEKEQGTLLALLGTELTSGSILVGKLLGASAWLARLFLIGLPLAASAAGYADLPLSRLLLAMAYIASFAFFLAAAALLAATLTKHTYETILGSYALLILVFLALSYLTEEISLPLWLHPIEFFHRASQLAVEPPAPLVLLCFFVFWNGLGLLALWSSSWLLRPLHFRQTDGPLALWSWARRPAVGDDPVSWRERHLLGVAPLPALRRVPTPLALFAVFLFAALCLLAEARFFLGHGVYETIRQADFADLVYRLHAMSLDKALQEIVLFGGLLLFLAPATVAVRGASSIADEKRRKTWEDLILTPLPLEQIVASKRRGIQRAALPYVAAYSLPMLLLAFAAGPSAIALALGLIAATVVLVFVAARLSTRSALEREKERRGGLVGAFGLAAKPAGAALRPEAS